MSNRPPSARTPFTDLLTLPVLVQLIFMIALMIFAVSRHYFF